MNKNIIIILLSDPKSTTENILLKSLNFIKKKKITYLLVGSRFFYKKLAKKTFIIEKLDKINKNKVNFYNIDKEKNIKNYINLITNFSITLLKKKKAIALINMPVNKKNLGPNCFGYTDFFSKKIGQYGKESMLLYNSKLSVCPITTHVQLKKVAKLINKKKIYCSIKNINHFYKNIIKKKINIKVCGLNPHAGKDIFNKNNEEKKIIIPLIKTIRKKQKNVSGPYSADTVFFNSNRDHNVIVGMYHDQILPTFKTLKKFQAINITLGLKYLRITPDHGTGIDLLKHKNKISNDSFKYCINFCEKYLNV